MTPILIVQVLFRVSTAANWRVHQYHKDTPAHKTRVTLNMCQEDAPDKPLFDIFGSKPCCKREQVGTCGYLGCDSEKHAQCISNKCLCPYGSVKHFEMNGIGVISNQYCAICEPQKSELKWEWFRQGEDIEAIL